MECPNKEASLALGNDNPQQSHSPHSSRTMSPARSLSEKESTHEKSSSETESPPSEPVNTCSQFCWGLWNGCSFGENHQPHCRLKCSPRACKQCREVGDEDWLRRGQWLEDCVTWDEEDDEDQPSEMDLPTRRRILRVTQIIVISVQTIIMAGMFYWSQPNLHTLEFP